MGRPAPPFPARHRVQREIGGASRQRFRHLAEQRRIGRPGENEPSRSPPFSDTPLHRDEQLRAALHFVENHGAFEQRFRIGPCRRQRGEVVEREARRAFQRFRSICFWSCRPDLIIGAGDVSWVAAEFAADRLALQHAGHTVDVELSQPGFVRAVVHWGEEATRVDWAHDSAWRFMPLVREELGGLLLHPVDLAINKVLALAGRDEPRDFVDLLFVHRQVLPLGAFCWAAAGTDPGFTPLSLLESLTRCGRYRPEDFSRLHLTEPFDLMHAKDTWLGALADAEVFVRGRPPEESGCLYFSTRRPQFVVPRHDANLPDQEIVPHFGTPGGVLPRIAATAGG